MRDRLIGPADGPLFEILESRQLLSAAPIVFTDGDGTTVRINLSGNGAIALVADGASFDLNLTGTDQGTKLTITTKGGDGRTQLGDIAVTGAIKSISAKTVDLLGDVSISGSAGTLTLGDLIAGAQHTLSIGGTAAAKPAKLVLRMVNDLTINSGTPLKSLEVQDWQDAGSDDRITAPELLKLESEGDLETNLTIVDDDEGNARLGKVTVDGNLDGIWFIDGKADGIKVGSAASTFSIGAEGKISSIESTGDLSGVWAGTSIGKVKVRGDLTGAKLLGGADLGDDAELGGSGDDEDLFFRGTISSVSVRGMMIDSIIAAGLDPADGVFSNGNDFVTGKSRSTVGSVKISGIADADSVLAAGRFSGSVKIGGTKIDPPGDPRFLLPSTEPDEDPPVIFAELETNTGDPNDNITSDATIIGRVTDLGAISRFRVGIDDDELDDFSSVSNLLEPNGTFELLQSRMEQINGGPLTAGLHTINFYAQDDAGNSAAIYTIGFVFVP